MDARRRTCYDHAALTLTRTLALTLTPTLTLNLTLTLTLLGKIIMHEGSEATFFYVVMQGSFI